jgi:hypothetical protein
MPEQSEYRFGRPVKQHLATGVVGTVWYALLASFYVNLVTQLPDSSIAHVDTASSPTAPEIVVPALCMLAMATVLAMETTHQWGESNA